MSQPHPEATKMNPRRTLIAITGALIALAAPATAAAAPALDGQFTTSGTPDRITLGPDGNVWFTMAGSAANKEFGKVAFDGTVTEYDTPTNGVIPVGITTGPDNNIWMTASNKMIRVPPANPAAMQEFTNVDLGAPQDITAGAGFLWTGVGDDVLKIDPATPTADTKINVPGLGARGIDFGPDGNVWVAGFGGQVAKVTPAGGKQSFPTGGSTGNQDIAAGPDGMLAFTQQGTNPHFLGRVNTAGGGSLLPQTNVPATDPFGIAFGTDGAWWFVQFLTQKVARMAADGTVTVPITLPSTAGARYGITRGANNTLWVTEPDAKKIARITGVDPPSTGGGGGGGTGTTIPTTTTTPPARPGPDTTPAQVSNVEAKPKRFVVGPDATAVAAARQATGTTLTYMLSEDAKVTLAIERVLPGRKKGATCGKPSRSNRKAKKCTRFVPQGTLTRTGQRGQNAVPFSGRIGSKALKPGNYRVGISGTDAAGNTGLPQYAKFTVLAAKKAKA
jgi:streptogramin lyase